MTSFILTAFVALSCTANAQTLRPSQIVSLYSDVPNSGQLFYFKDTRKATNSIPQDGNWLVPRGKTFMLTEISALFDYGTNGLTNALTCPAYLNIAPEFDTNMVVATFFSVGYGMAVNTTFATPIPIQSGVTISHTVRGSGEIILRGYLTPTE
jgi:hypothetical protein